MAGSESEASLYQEPRGSFDEDAEEEIAEAVGSGEETATSWSGADSGFYYAVSPYRTLLDSLGHAVYVYSVSSGKITYWSRSAESLYHWDAEEIVGQRMVDVLVSEEYHSCVRKIMKKVCSGQTWYGQFPFQRRSGEQFMALVAKSPMYEDGELLGVVTVSSDAALFNRMHPPDENQYEPHGKGLGSNLKKIQCLLPRPQTAAAPQASSSVSNLAPKFLPPRQGDDFSCARMSSVGRDEHGAEVASSKFEQSVPMADKFLVELQSKIMGDHGNEDTSILQNDINKKLTGVPVIDKGDFAQTPMVTPAGECYQYFRKMNQGESHAKQKSYLISDVLGAKTSILNGVMEDDLMIQPNGDHFPGPVGFIRSLQSPSSKVNNELSAVSSCQIRWKDLQLWEEVGQGSFAVVYRGIWNGSDVAVKVYAGGDYKVVTWLDCKNEIDIMKTLRHPNVLLFMGAVYSRERFALVTEFMPRGSLFKILHNANPPLGMKRRIRMALDVARGINYLHRRNPPIVHRDLKSSNLLVDRNWNVKVGDFGLSKWKNATFLSTKSGRGTPHWMAPEVLRNEPSNEKSDVFSFGVILWELMTVSVPWGHLNSLQVIGVVGFMDRRLDLPEGLNPGIASIIRDCWHNDPAVRPSIEEIIQRMTSLFRKPGLGQGPGRLLLPDED